eukprot:8680006-Alexandrium_andersonii.AAC.1
MALSTAWWTAKVGSCHPHCQTQEATRTARRLLRLDLRNGGRRPSPIPELGRGAVRPVGRAGTAAPSGWVLGPEI